MLGEKGGSVMGLYQEMFMIIAACGIVLLILAVKTNSHLILNFILRSITGSLLIVFFNFLLKMGGYFFMVGLNPVTVLTSGILGFPGVVLLYGIKIYEVL